MVIILRHKFFIFWGDNKKLGTCDNIIKHVGVLSLFFSFIYLFIWVTIKIDLLGHYKVIHKVRKHMVLILGLGKKMMNTKRHDGHFLKVKKIGANSKLFLNLRSKEFPFVSCVFFNNASVIEVCVFCKEGLKSNQFLKTV